MTVIASQTWVVTDSAPVRVQPADLHKFDGKGLKVIDLKRGGDGKPGILHDTDGKIAVYLSLGRGRLVFDHGLTVQFRQLHDAIAGNELDEMAVDPAGKFGHQVLFLWLVFCVTDDTG